MLTRTLVILIILMQIVMPVNSWAVDPPVLPDRVIEKISNDVISGAKGTEILKLDEALSEVVRRIATLQRSSGGGLTSDAEIEYDELVGSFKVKMGGLFQLFMEGLVADPEALQEFSETMANLAKKPTENTVEAAIFTGEESNVEEVNNDSVSSKKNKYSSLSISDSEAIEEVRAKNSFSFTQKATAAALAGLTITCGVASCVLNNEWASATLMTLTASLFYVAAGYIAPAIPLSKNLSRGSQLLMLTLISQSIASPGAIFENWATVKALEPGSTLNLVALKSILTFCMGILGSVSSVALLNQPGTWPTWVGMVIIGLTAAFQAGYAINYST